MRVLICGTRHVIPDHARVIREILTRHDPKTDVIVHGNATGVDSTVDTIAREMKFTIDSFSAEWNKFGRKAGPIRNQKMIASKPDIVYALPYPSLEKSTGTADTCKRAKVAGIYTIVIQPGRSFVN